MPVNQFGTAAAAAGFLAALSLGPPPAISTVPTIPEKHSRPLFRAAARSSLIDESQFSGLQTATRISTTFVDQRNDVGESDRPTTLREKIVGELRRWSLLTQNWDGEGALAPDPRSFKDAQLFVHLLGAKSELPVPMVHASGRAGLYWDGADLYADIEFLGNGRVTYYIEQGDEGKHKGVLQFKHDKMPSLFQALLNA